MPQATLKLRVIPRARKDQTAGEREGAIIVRLQAPPVEGAANRALTKFLAKTLGVRASDITITSGDKSRDKVVVIEGISQQEAEKALK